jgi:hypothetical protein
MPHWWLLAAGPENPPADPACRAERQLADAGTALGDVSLKKALEEGS